MAQSLNQGFVRFESSLHPYFTIFVGRLGNYFKLHPLFFKPIKEKGKDKDKDRVNGIYNTGIILVTPVISVQGDPIRLSQAFFSSDGPINFNQCNNPIIFREVI